MTTETPQDNRELALEGLEDAVILALEAGMTADQIRDEVDTVIWQLLTKLLPV